MKKRILSFATALVLIFTSAIAASAVEVRASPTLALYSAMLTKGSSAGKISISYDVRANTEAEEVGVSSIKIYTASDDKYVTTITGSVRNGLIAANTERHRSSYTYTGKAKTEYYAIVTVTATINGTTDTRDITTNSLTAP